MPASTGIASIASSFSVETTLEKLKAFIAAKGLQLFAHIDHRAGAKAAGLDMQPAHVLIFGTAKAGTPLMVANPLLALDLPLKVLVWEDPEKKVWASYNTPEFLIQRHSLPADLARNISGVEGLIRGSLGVS
ncbi:MAG TPA: DUF302 domain-containing protein [Candidatus Methylacidiphilales bacterium]|jgi:uncharacterized protein (DUF302 family)|nr:DUF302 domain-containing protein [Candidatus Methylacidiphilales bacterium]